MMSRHEIILIVISVLGSAIAFGVPSITLLWKAFNTIADLRLQIAENRNQIHILTNKVDHLDERWEMATAQTLQRFEHFSNRLKGEVVSLELQMREVQNFLSKTTPFEVRSQGK